MSDRLAPDSVIGLVRIPHASWLSPPPFGNPIIDAVEGGDSAAALQWLISAQLHLWSPRSPIGPQDHRVTTAKEIVSKPGDFDTMTVALRIEHKAARLSNMLPWTNRSGSLNIPSF